MSGHDNPFSGLCRIGFGAWAIGGPYEFGWGPVDDKQSIAAILTAVEYGIDWIDTAPAYGYGHSEKVVGRAVRSAQGIVKIFTKCGRVWDSGGKVTSDLRPHAIRAQWAESVERLGTDIIDLYQIHRPDSVTGTPLSASWEEMVRLREEGKVRSIGLCNVTTDQFNECASIGHVDALQTPVNALRPGDVNLRLSAINAGTYVLAFSPMESGLLTGAFSTARIESLPSDDWRKRSAKFDSAALVSADRIVRALEIVSIRTGYSVPALAVAWSLRQPGVSASIVGARNPEQVAEWRDGESVRLDDEIWAEVDRLAGVPSV